MKKILLFFFLLPFFCSAQECTTEIVTTNADSVVYCVDSVSCNSYCDGRIEISVYPQSAIYYYNWDSVAVVGNNIIDSLCAGTPGVTITDVNGQFIIHLDIPVYEPSPINNFSSITHPTCYNDTDGEIDITTNGGTSPFTYNWNTGLNAPDLLFISGGIYELITTDNNNCKDTSSYILNNPNEVNSVTITDTLSCIDMCDGDAIVIPNSGFTPYTYLWSDGQTNDTATNLCYGLNTVYITDANGCLDTNTVFIENPDTLKLSSIIIDSSCYQICDGQIIVSIEGGSSPYDVYWSLNSIIFDSVTTTIDDLCPNIYQLTFTDDNNCTATENINLLERDSFNLQSSVINDSCYNSCTGQITVQLLNQNSPPFIYSWENGQSDSVISNLCSDSISLELIDNRGCRDTFFFFVNQPSILSFDSVSVVDNVCFSDENGSITINISGGTGNISTLWTGINNYTSSIVDITNLLSSSYTLHIEDQNMCTKDTIILVDQPDTLIAIHSVQDASCKFYSDGIINVNLFGGTTPYVFTWGNLIIDSNYVDSIPSGDYIYTVTDSNGCIAKDTATINEPELIDISDSIIDVLCNGYHTGAIDLTVGGGTLPYDFLWSNLETTDYLIDIGEGVYSVLITDQNNCTLTESFIVSEPSFPITTNIVGIDILCFGENTGSADLSVSGGTSPYTFLWNNAETTEDIDSLEAGIYTVDIIDDNGCDTVSIISIIEPTAITVSSSITNLLCFEDGLGAINITTTGGSGSYSYLWSTGATTEDIPNLMAGNYLLTVTDANNCPYSESFQVQQPELFQTNFITAHHLDCFGADNGSIDFEVTGGTAPIEIDYLWNTGITTSSLENLGPGIYTVTAEDGNNCPVVKDSIEIFEPSQITIMADSIMHSTCYGEDLGRIYITASGGVGGFTYAWNNGTNIQDLSNVSSGNYEVIVTDANDCERSAIFFIDQPNPFLETVNVNSVNTCNGDATGSIDFSIVGNTSPYTYLWSNSATSPSIANLTAGNYDIAVRDINNCETNYSYLITEPEALELDYTVQPASCEEKNDGAIYASVKGGFPPIYYSWSNGEDVQNIMNLSNGNYTLEVEDANACKLPLEYIEVNFDGFDGCIEIPSGFTPNGDGIHDEWSIKGLYYFSDVLVKVYNRWGQELFDSIGYKIPWDGKYQGIDLPTATYYYVIELADSEKVFNGTVTIKR